MLIKFDDPVKSPPKGLFAKSTQVKSDSYKEASFDFRLFTGLSSLVYQILILNSRKSQYPCIEIQTITACKFKSLNSS